MSEIVSFASEKDIALLPKLPLGKKWIPVQLGESGDRVYRRSDGISYAKIGARSRLDNERLRLEWLSTTDISSPVVLDWIVSSEGRACLLSSPIPGVPASTLSAPALKRAWLSLARQIKALHDLPVTGCPFSRSLPLMMARAEGIVARATVNRDFLAPEQRDTPPPVLLAKLKEELPKRLSQETEHLVVCHGDACLPNFMIDPETLRCTGMLDLGRLGIADRYADLALLLGNARETWLTAQDVESACSQLFAHLDLRSPDTALLDFYLRLDPLTWG